MNLSPKIEAALRAVPRHLFLPGVSLDKVYRNDAIATKFEGERPLSSSSQPSAMVAMLEQLDLEPGHHVLEIGAGTGFNAALMAYLVGETGKVTTIDIDEDIVMDAREHLRVAGLERVEVLCGDGGQGHTESAPYDRMMVTASADDLPPAWREQLKPGGRLVVPLSILPGGRQITVAFERSDNYLGSTSITNCAFMPLRGAFPGVLPSGDRRIQLGPKPGLELRLKGDDQRTIDPEAIYKLLTGPSKDYPTGIHITPYEMAARYSIWSALRKHEMEYQDLRCSLSAEGEQANRQLVPYLFGLAGKVCSTGGLLNGESMAVWTRAADHLPPQEGSNNESPFELFVRSYGPDTSLSEYLVDRIRKWDAEGRPPDENRLRVRAYPLEADYSSLPNEIIIERRSTRFVIDW